MKKYLALILAALLVTVTLTGCAGQTNEPERGMESNASTLASKPGPEAMPNNSLSREDYEKLSALQFDDYQHMKVSEFQNKVWRMTDTAEYRDLLERLFQDEALYQLKDSDETAWFLFYILEPLTAENWQTHDYSGAAESDLPYPAENAMLEYTYTLTILDAEKVMVKDYNDMRLGVKDAMNDILRNRTKEELQNETLMLTELKAYTDEMLGYFQTPEVSAAVEYAYFPLTAENDDQASGYLPDDEEQRRCENGTEEDYRSLLALKTADYSGMSVADFNEKLILWADEDHDRMERVDADTLWDDFQVRLSGEERNFIRLTVFLSGRENGELMRSIYTGAPAADPTYQESLPQKTDESNEKWCDFGYRFSYHIADSEKLTIGERDRSIGGMISAVQKFWDETPLNDLLTMTKEYIISRLTSLADEYSNDAIAITISAGQVHFEHAEERAEEP